MPSLLAHIPGGTLLDPPVPAGADYNFTGLSKKLYDSLTEPQRLVYDSGKRFVYLCSGRRFGKTYLAVTRLINWAIEKPGGLFFYTTATYRMAKQIAWVQLKQMVPPEIFASKNESELSVTLTNGSQIFLKGAEDPDKLRGISLSGVVIDEASFVKQEAWTMVLRPALSDQEGPAWFITTPNGLNWFAEAWDAAEEDDECATFSFTTIEGGQVSPEEVAAARRSLDARTFSQEYEASFVNLIGRVVPDFDDNNIRDDVADLGGELLVAADFNVSPMHWIVCQRVGRDQLHCIDELHIRETHTDEACSELLRRYPNREIRVYPDPTGNARKTAAGGVTDHGILRNRGLWVNPNRKPYGQADKRNAVNAMVKDADDVRRLFIHPRCRQTIKSLRNLTFKEGTNMPDKDSGWDHGWDALSYLVLGAFDRVKPWKTGSARSRQAQVY